MRLSKILFTSIFLFSSILLSFGILVPQVFATGQASPAQSETYSARTVQANDPGDLNPLSKAAKFEKEVARLVNKERKKRGLKPLHVHVRLFELARDKSEDMRDKDYFSHTSPSGKKQCNKVKKEGISAYCGENIAAGSKTPKQVVKQWMNSPGHRANILHPKYTHIGVGYAEGGGRYHRYWTQLFVKIKK